jgi:hypothetical protein
MDACRLDIGNAQELHVLFVEGFVASSFETEFGRHVALFHPLSDFPALRQRVVEAGGELVEPMRSTPFRRMFFREPINGYLFEVIDDQRHPHLFVEQIALILHGASRDDRTGHTGLGGRDTRSR